MELKWPVVFAVQTPFWLIQAIGIVLFWRQRRFFPLAPRLPLTTVLTLITILIYSLFISLQRHVEDEWPAAIYPWSSFLLTGCIFNGFFMRVWKLYWTWTATNLRLLGFSHKKSGSISAISILSAFSRGTTALSNTDAATGRAGPNKRIAAEIERCRRFTTTRFMRRMICCSCLVQALIPVLIHVVWPLPSSSVVMRSRTADGSVHANTSMTTMLASVVSGVYAVIFLIFSWFMRKLQDGYGIKSELRAAGLTIILGVVGLQVVLIVAPYPDPSDVFVLELCLFGVHVCSCWYPLLLAKRGGYQLQGKPLRRGRLGKAAPKHKHASAAAKYRSARVKQQKSFGSLARQTSVSVAPQSVHGLREQFEIVVATIAGQEAFQRFLVYEFSIENYQFRLEVNRTKARVASFELGTLEPADPNTVDCVKHAIAMFHHIKTSFIGDRSPNEVNLSYERVAELQEFFEQLDSINVGQCGVATEMHPAAFWKRLFDGTVFDAAFEDICELMASDSFVRFKRSPLFPAQFHRLLTIQLKAEQ